MASEGTEQLLTHHWALDTQAAEMLSERIDASGQAHQIEAIAEQVESNADALKQRDLHRERLGRIFTGEQQEGLMVIGPCSLDGHSDYSELFDYIEELQEEHPDAVIALRANSAKPRTSGGWTGLWYSTDPEERAKIFQTYSDAMNRNIPILAEITQETQLGALAPWMSAAWLGARDIASTTLRSVVSAIHLPIGIKNSVDGDPAAVRNTLKAIRRSSEDNDDSGVDLGAIASNATSPGIATGILPVGKGNHEAAIIARGYILPEGLSKKERHKAALDSLSSMCILAAEMGTAVLIDGTHDVPVMFDIPRSNADRILPVLKKINHAVHSGDVVNGDRITGILAEVGPNAGKTDPNFVLDEKRKKDLSKLIGKTLKIVS